LDCCRSISAATAFRARNVTSLPHPDLPEAPKATYANLELSIEPEQINLKRKAKYHWKGLLAQSMEFSLMENGFRLATDDTMRFQLAHKPFWHDYVAFIKQYNMGPWHDGESFLVNYVGHPLQAPSGHTSRCRTAKVSRGFSGTSRDTGDRDGWPSCGRQRTARTPRYRRSAKQE
jgi:hypothetical protein